jgi:hypothetical protein
VRSRLRRRIREGALHKARGRLSRRARARYFVGGERARAALARESGFVRSGVSAAAEHGASLRAPNVLEGYLPEGELDSFAYRFALRQADEREADLIVRGIAHFWPFGDRKVAPRAAVAVDLLDSLDERTRRAGEHLLRGIGR